MKRTTLRLLCRLAILVAGWSTTARALDFETTAIAGKSITICRVDLTHDHLGLFLTDDAGNVLGNFSALDALLSHSGRKLLFAMNAGMYEPDWSPVGLFLSNGHQFHPLNTARGAGNFYMKPNGVFAITTAGACILPTEEYPRLTAKVMLATQSGPMLVISGRIHPAFNPRSESRLFRNGVGVVSPHEVVFAISEAPVSFYELATLFRDKLHCANALFLDGTVSSLYAPQLGRNDRKIKLGPIIGVAQ
jgi:uncharacterized protein YigE (DUF2233 family)